MSGQFVPDPFGHEPTGDPVFTTTLSHVDDTRTRRKASRRSFDRSPALRRRRQVFRLIAIFVAILAIVAAVFGAYDIIGIQQQGNAPLAALQQFCSYEIRQDYFGAYSMVSNELADGFSLDDFEAVNTTRDQQYGTVTGCSQIQRDYSRAFGWSHAAFSLTVTTTKGTYQGTVLLAQEVKPDPGQLAGDTEVWTIDEVSPDAHLE